MLVTTVWLFALTLFSLCTRFLLVSSFLLSFFSWMGWIRRFMWLTLESELSKALNGAPVTIGSLEVDLLAGKLFVSNLVIHTRLRQEWKWEAPLIARIGKLHLEFDLLSILQRFYRQQQLVLDIYALEISDVQVFVERQESVFNFFLLNPLMELPDPKEVFQRTELSKEQVSTDDKNETVADNIPVEDLGVEEEQKAQVLVSQMCDAVQNIGRDAQKGGWKEALVRQRQSLTLKLKELQNVKKTEAMHEGVQVLRKVGKVVAIKTKSFNLPKPKRKENSKTISPLFVRVGRVLLQDGRIFTRSEEYKWNRPITLKQIWIRATELCPPMSLNDENDKPALYQPIDKVVEVVWKRILAEIAKSQSGRLFHTAVGEVLGFIKSNTDGGMGEAI